MIWELSLCATSVDLPTRTRICCEDTRQSISSSTLPIANAAFSFSVLVSFAVVHDSVQAVVWHPACTEFAALLKQTVGVVQIQENSSAKGCVYSRANINLVNA